MEIATLIGLMAGVFSTLGFVPQVIKTWRTKSSRDLSLGTFSVLVTGALLWLVYGALTWDIPLLLANSLSLVLLVGMLALMVWYRREDYLRSYVRSLRRAGLLRRRMYVLLDRMRSS